MKLQLYKKHYIENLRLAAPVMLSQVGIASVQLFDNAMVGKLGALPLAAVSFGGTVFFMIFIAIKVIYTIAPNVTIPSKSVNKGALFTTIIWGATTFIYSFYVTHLANYSKFYGNLSNLIILMIWIYWMSYIFVLGMTINNYKLNEELEKTSKIKSLD